MLKKYLLSAALGLALIGCSGSTAKDNNISTQASTPVVPTISYQSLVVSGEGVGPFSLAPFQEGIGSAINYQSRMGVINVFEQVVQDPTTTGYVTVEKAYSFGDKYVLIVSTGESGLSCSATTYAFIFDTKTESVTGKTTIDGCSETVDSLADGNKLTIKKEGAPMIIYNAEITKS